MTASELYALGKALEELERPKAEARQAHGLTAPGRSVSPETKRSARTKDIVGPAVGLSGTQK